MPPTITADVLRLIDTSISYTQYINQIPSISIGIVHKGKIIFKKSYGYADLQKKKRATPQTCYRIASISKLFTAIAIMQLKERGKLSLNNKIIEFLRWFPDKKVTIKHLLTHTGGICRDGETSHWFDNNFPTLEQLRSIQNFTTYKPSQTWKYSNIGFALLGQVIEAITNQPYPTYIQKNILQKLRLTHTSVDLDKKVLKNLAVGYGRKLPGKGRRIFRNIRTKSLLPAGGFTSNVEDMCKFLIAQMNTSLLSNSSLKEMRLRHVKNVEGELNWGLGYQISKLKNELIFGHSGGFRGYKSCVGYHPNKQLGVVVLANFEVNPNEFLAGIFHTLLSSPKTNKAQYKKYECAIRSDWQDLSIQAIGSKLFLCSLNSYTPLHQPYELKHITKDTFQIIQGNKFGYIGEEVKFTFKGRKVFSVKIGPNTWEMLNY